MITLPNGKSIDLDMLETAMEDSHHYNQADASAAA